MKIQKTSETRALAGNIVNAYSESQNSAYSAEYANNTFLAKGTVLYNNSTGTTGEVTLSENASNYSYLEIYFSTSGGFMKSIKVPTTTEKFCMDITYFGSDNTMYINSAMRTISTNKIGIDGTRYGGYSYTGSAHSKSQQNDLYIKRVVGYKY